MKKKSFFKKTATAGLKKRFPLTRFTKGDDDKSGEKKEMLRMNKTVDLLFPRRDAKIEIPLVIYLPSNLIIDVFQ